MDKDFLKYRFSKEGRILFLYFELLSKMHEEKKRVHEISSLLANILNPLLKKDFCVTLVKKLI